MAISNLTSWTLEAVREFQSKIKSWVLDLIPTKTSQLINDSGFITSNEVPLVNVDSSSWTGDKTYTIDGSNAGKLIYFGTIPKEVTSLKLKLTGNIVSVVLDFYLESGTELTELSVVDSDNNPLPLPEGTESPSEFGSDYRYQISILFGICRWDLVKN